MNKRSLLTISITALAIWRFSVRSAPVEQPLSQAPIGEFNTPARGGDQQKDSRPLHVRRAAKAVEHPSSDAESATEAAQVDSIETAVADHTRGQSDSDKEELLPDQGDRAALAAWKEEKNVFYRDELLLTEEEMTSIDSLTEEISKQIRQLVTEIDDDRLDQGIRDGLQVQMTQKLKLLDDRVFVILGHERYDRAVTFRKDFNMAIRERFHARLKFTGF